ncbi:MAG: hypothetical protein OXM02_04585, partial [Bacteroidota bacterium]|nr:hypothetical protein [Bacteroidota bacterium]
GNISTGHRLLKGGAPLTQTLNTFFNKNQTHNHPETWTFAFHNSQREILNRIELNSALRLLWMLPVQGRQQPP